VCKKMCIKEQAVCVQENGLEPEGRQAVPVKLCLFSFMGVDVCGPNDCGICAYGTFTGMMSHQARAECRSRYMRRLFTCFQISRHAGIVGKAGRAADSKRARDEWAHE
jgi:hypothetical protein